MIKITIFGESEEPISDEKEALLMALLDEKFKIHVTKIDKERIQSEE